MKDSVARALEAASDAAAVDWDALESQTPDPDRSTVRALRVLTELARAHSSGADERKLPFTWGPLHVRAHIAHGAHGDVYRAWDPRLQRDVALKLLRDACPDDRGEPAAIAEGRRLARVRDPHVVSVYGADHVDGQAGIWMEFVQGANLDEIVRRNGPLPVSVATDVALAVCSGLAAIHDAGLVHRDVKAQNVVRDASGRIQLMDLGAGQELARPQEGMAGTPLYLAPELLNGAQATVASDIYAVGVLLFYLVTGRYPVDAVSLDELRLRHRSEGVERLTGTVNIPLEFSAIVDRALARDPAVRFPSAAVMKSALDHARRPRATPAITVVGIILLVATIAALATLAFDSGATDPRGGPHEAAKDRIITLPHYPVGGPSADGRYLPYVADGRLAVWDVPAGRSMVVLDATPEGQPVSASISRHGDRIAYGWKNANGGYELRTVGVDARWMETLLPRQYAYDPLPLEWSRDDRAVLCQLRQQDGTSDLVLVPVNGAQLRHLHTFGSPGTVHARLSPDGRFAVASLMNADDLGSLLILPTDGSHVARLLEGDSYGRPAWTPDGGHIVFLREPESPSGMRDAWVVKVVDGRAAGEPVRVRSGLGAVLDFWVTDDGALYQVTSTLSSNIYLVSIDLSGGSPAGPPSRIAPQHIGQQVAPAWSPDGGSIAFIVRDSGDSPGLILNRSLWIKDLVFGGVRRVPVPLKFLGGYAPSWRPDGRAIAVWGRDTDAVDRFGYFEVDLQSGDVRPLVDSGVNAPTYSQYGPDGRLFLYVDTQRGIIARDLDGTGERILAASSPASTAGTFALSPDGRQLAFVATTREGSVASNLRVHALGGEGRVVMRVEAPESLVVHGWSPKSDAIVYGRVNGARQKIWRISPAGGDPVDLRFEGPIPPNPFRLNPAGTRLAFPERVRKMELRVLVHIFEPRHLGPVPR